MTDRNGAAAPQPETWQGMLETLLPIIKAGTPADHAVMLAGLIVQLQQQVAELSGITEAHGIMLRRLTAAAMTRPGTS